MQVIAEWDRAVFLWLNRSAGSEVLDLLMPCITQLGLGQLQAVLVPVAALVAAWRGGETRGRRAASAAWGAIYRRREWVGPLLMAIVFAGIGSNLLKGAAVRERPWQYYHGYDGGARDAGVRVRTVPGVYPMKVRGFPSGHTATTVAMAAVLTALPHRTLRRRRVLAGVWLMAALVGFSRIYLASHWPLDVIGGAVVGIATGLLALAACRRWASADAPAPGEPAAAPSPAGTDGTVSP